MKIIDKFLAEWKATAKKFYTEMNVKYIKLDNDYRKATEHLPLSRKPYCWGYDRQSKIASLTGEALESFKKCQNFKNALSKKAWEFISDKYYLDTQLDTFLDREVEAKKKNLIVRIEKKAGKIIDGSFLKIGVDGNLNGLVKGEIKEVEVTTIYAGGYNIQCLHYRVLVK